jgi:hypothetical protein
VALTSAALRIGSIPTLGIGGPQKGLAMQG